MHNLSFSVSQTCLGTGEQITFKIKTNILKLDKHFLEQDI